MQSNKSDIKHVIFYYHAKEPPPQIEKAIKFKPSCTLPFAKKIVNASKRQITLNGEMLSA